MSNDNTNDKKTEPTEEATTDDGSLLEKNLTRRTALIGAGLVGSAAASQSASGVDIEVNEPGAADNDNPPAQGDDPAEVLSLTLESDDVIVDVDGSGDIEKSYLDDMGFPSTDPEVLPGDRVSNIEPEDRLVTTRMNSFDVNNDHIFQAPVFDATNELTYYPYGHAFGDDEDPVPGGLPDTLNPAIGIKVDSIGIGQSNKSVSSSWFSPPGSGTFSDRVPGNVSYSGSIPGNGFSYVSGSSPAEFSFDDHRQEVTLRNVGNNNEIVEDEANQVGLSSLFSTIGSDNSGQIFQLGTTDPILVIGDGYQNGKPQPVDGSIPSTGTFVSAEGRDGIVDTDIIQQQVPDDRGSVVTVTSEDSFNNHVFKDPTGDAVLRIPVLETDSVTGIVDPVEEGDALGIIEGTPDQDDDIMLLSTGEIVPGDSVGSQAGSGNAFGSDSDGFYLDVVAATPDRNTLVSGQSDFDGDDIVALEVEEIADPDVGTTDTRYLDSKGAVLDELEMQINALTRSDASVVVQDVGAVDNINDGDGDIDGIVIRSTTEVDDAYDQNVAVSSVEISSLPGSDGNRGLFGSGPGTAHPETTDIVTDLGLQDGTFNAVNADTVVSDDIYKAQADPIDAVNKVSAENEQLGDFEVTNNGISEGEDATERVASKEETRTNDLVYRDSLNSSAGSAQDLGPTGSSNESNADRFGPNPDETQFHDGFDILELREPVEETASADVPHNPRGLGPGETNIDVYYGDRFDGIRVKNEGNLEGDNIENVQLGVMEPGESNNIDGEMWTVEKQIGDDGFDAQDTIYWFSREDLAEVSNLLDFVYFGDNTKDDNGSFEEEDPDELVNDNVDVDHTSELTVSINVVNANEVGSPDEFGDTALFEVMDLEETTPQVDGEFDTFTSDPATSAESGLFFKGHGDRGDIAASAGVSGSTNQIQLANLYEPSNEVVPAKYYYGDSEGDVDVDGLLNAIRDYRDSKIGVNRLLEVVGEFR